MDAEAFVDYPALERFADEVRQTSGWLMVQCSTPATSATAAASSALDWPDGELNAFAFRMDQQISSISMALHAFVTGLGKVVAAYNTTDLRLAGE